MAQANPKVAAMVERALKKDRELKSAELKQRARKIDPSVERLSARQFHALYALPVRRRLFPRGSPKSAAGRKPVRRKRSSSSGRQSIPDDGVLSQAYNQSKSELNSALDGAFSRAIKADSAKKVDRLLAAMQRDTSAAQRL